MSNKKKIYGILICSAIVVLVSLILSQPDIFGFCGEKDIKCIDSYYNYIDKFNNLFPSPTINVVQIAFVFAIPLFIFSAFLLFMKEQIYRTWIKFSIIFLPISIFISIWMAWGTHGTLISIDEEMSSFFLASIFTIVSLLIIIFKSIQLRREEKRQVGI